MPIAPVGRSCPVALAAALVLLCAAAAAAAGPAPVGPRLQAAAAVAPADAPLPVWVFFRDRGLTGPQRTAALAAAEARLSARTLDRRARSAGPGRPVVDERDLPLDPHYLARVRDLGAVPRRQSRWLNAASFLVAPGIVPELARLDCVAHLELVAGRRRPEPPIPAVPLATVPRGGAAKAALWFEDYGFSLTALEQINVPPVHEAGLTGQGVVVGLLDTGFRTTHEALAGLPVLGAYDFVGDDPVVDFEPGDPDNAVYHGTMILSILAGYRPGRLVGPGHGVSVLLAKTEDVASETPVEEDYWVAGLEWLEAQGADIVSSSLGYSDWYTYEEMDGDTAVTTVAGDLAVGRGLVVVVSAGNTRASLGYMTAPADGDSVIAVGAVDSLGLVTAFSAPGPTADGRIKPDVMALGWNTPVASPVADDQYLAVAGTSASCPLAAGAAALLLSRLPTLTPMQVREALRATSDRAGSPNNDYGWGVVDAQAAVNYWGPVFTHQGLGDTADDAGPYPVAALITARQGIVPGSPILHYRVDGGSWTSIPLAGGGTPDEYAAAIPGQPLGSHIEYYLDAAGQDGFTTAWPVAGPADPAGFEVTALSPLSVSVQPEAAIPMDDPAGLASVITLGGAQSGIVVAVDVDVAITHPDVSELTVVLTGPNGAAVTLHRRTDPGTSDLAGNWPATLTVDGPGGLAAFAGESNRGDWTLTVSDALTPQTGELVSWGLNFVLKDFVSGGGRPPRPTTMLRQNFPNPFNPRTSISFELGRAGQTRLSIFDARGMLIRTLVDRRLEAGPHTRIWDGLDRAGRAAGSGIYLYRLETPETSLERKMLLLR